jgi:hypothetical protein
MATELVQIAAELVKLIPSMAVHLSSEVGPILAVRFWLSGFTGM